MTVDAMAEKPACRVQMVKEQEKTMSYPPRITQQTFANSKKSPQVLLHKKDETTSMQIK